MWAAERQECAFLLPVSRLGVGFSHPPPLLRIPHRAGLVPAVLSADQQVENKQQKQGFLGDNTRGSKGKRRSGPWLWVGTDVGPFETCRVDAQGRDVATEIH